MEQWFSQYTCNDEICLALHNPYLHCLVFIQIAYQISVQHFILSKLNDKQRKFQTIKQIFTFIRLKYKKRRRIRNIWWGHRNFWKYKEKRVDIGEKIKLQLCNSIYFNNLSSFCIFSLNLGKIKNCIWIKISVFLI